jgi:HK97 family phage prohead protease
MSTLDRVLAEAAEARSAGVRAPADRPSQRRCDEQTGSLAVVRASVTGGLQLRAAADGGSGLDFEGFASVYARAYPMWDAFGPYSEQVSPGAGAVSLARADLDVPFVLAHDSLRRMARTIGGSLSLSEETVDDTEGLLVRAPNLDPTDADVAYIAPKLRAGLIDEMSFRFRIDAGSWSPDWTEYHIDQYDIHRGDVAIVGYGANPFTQGAGLRSELALPALSDLTEARLVQLGNDLTAERKARGLDAAKPAMTYAQLLLMQD